LTINIEDIKDDTAPLGSVSYTYTRMSPPVDRVYVVYAKQGHANVQVDKRNFLNIYLNMEIL